MKNLLRAQSKYGLLGSSAKAGKIFYSRVPIISMLSPSSPHHVVSMVSTPHGPHIPIVSVVPTSSLSSPHHPHIIPTSSRRSLHHPYTPTYPLHPPPTPLWCGRPRISINSIRFELIEIFQFCLKI